MAVAAVLAGDRNDALGQRGFIIRHLTCPALRRAGLPQHLAGTPLGDRLFPQHVSHVQNGPLTFRRAQ